MLQAEEGEAGTGPPAEEAPTPAQPGGGAGAWQGTGGGGRKVEAAESLMSTGEREKRL